MKKKIILSLILLILISCNIAYCILVDGYAYLNNHSNHSGIKVVFERTVPSILADSTYSDLNGNYSINLETGIYNVSYSKEDYHSIYLFDEVLYSNTSFQDFTLTGIPGILAVPFPYNSIQFAIELSHTSDTILVDQGIYYENIDFLGKDITVSSLFLSTADTTYIAQTVIDGNQNGSVVTFINNEDSASILSGFTITNGTNSGQGGGIFCDSSSPSLENLLITGNNDNYGAGISCNESSPNIYNVTIKNNSANSRGGGICSRFNSSPNLENVKIMSNTAGEKGAGFYCAYNSSPSLVNVEIIDNIANGDGGGFGIYDDSSPTLTNVTITNNTSNSNGGGIFSSQSTPIIVNSIVSNNSGNYGIYVDSYGIPVISYSDFYDNDNGNFYGCDPWVGINVTTNTNGDSCDAFSNIQLDPLFVDAANGDYHLTENSPCIDAGDPNYPFDPDGTISDMGTFYFNQLSDIDEDEIQNLNMPLNNYPNPFNPTTTIEFSIQNNSIIELSIYNIKGQKVKTLISDQLNAGKHSVVWNGDDNFGVSVSSGVYLYKLKVNGKTEAVKKCLLLK